MMEIANSANAKLSFFLDFCEEGSYGQDEITKISNNNCEKSDDNVIFFILFGLAYAYTSSMLILE